MTGLSIDNKEVSVEALARSARDIPGAWTGLKIAALILAQKGWRTGELCDTFGLSRQTLARWVHEANEKGLESLEKTPPPGRPKQLTEDIREELEKDINKSPEHFGFAKKRWTGPVLARHLESKYDINVKVRQARNYLQEIGYESGGMFGAIKGTGRLSAGATNDGY